MRTVSAIEKHRPRYGRLILISLGVTWAVAMLLSFALFAVPHVIPDCTFGGKTTSVQCGALTPLVNGALEWFFVLGTFLIIVTIPWLVAGVITFIVEARREKTSA